MQEIINANVLTNNTAFVGPSICCDREGFYLTDVLNAGYLNEDRAPNMALVTTQRYPSNNCQLNGVINPQDIFAEFLNHTSAQALTNPYLADIATVRGAGKDVVMLEMNSASCGGFPGLSDSFGVAMWSVASGFLDHGLPQDDRLGAADGLRQFFWRAYARWWSGDLLQS